MAERRNALTTRDASGSANATLVVLPASAAKVDRELVERAVSHIRDELAKTVTRGMDEVGRYLLQTFYDDDPDLYLSASPNKHASLRLLIERCESMDFPVSRTFLANALRMAAVSKGLPRAATFRRLPSSHRIELLRLKAPENVERLASKAISQKLSVQKLRALIQKEVERSSAAPGRGRKRTPQALRAIEACLRALRDEETGKLLVRRSDVDDMTEEQLALAQTALASLEKRVVDLRRLLS
jgi:hypothetical protein